MAQSPSRDAAVSLIGQALAQAITEYTTANGNLTDAQIVASLKSLFNSNL